MKSDLCSKFSNLSNWKEAWKNLNLWPLRYLCDALPTELWSHTLGARSIYWVDIFPCSEMMWSLYEIIDICTAVVEVTDSNPVEALIFFTLLLSSCLNWKIYCDDHISLSSTTAVQIWIISYKLHIISLHGKIWTQ